MGQSNEHLYFDLYGYWKFSNKLAPGKTLIYFWRLKTVLCYDDVRVIKTSFDTFLCWQ